MEALLHRVAASCSRWALGRFPGPSATRLSATWQNPNLKKENGAQQGLEILGEVLRPLPKGNSHSTGFLLGLGRVGPWWGERLVLLSRCLPGLGVLAFTQHSSWHQGGAQKVSVQLTANVPRPLIALETEVTQTQSLGNSSPLPTAYQELGWALLPPPHLISTASFISIHSLQMRKMPWGGSQP